MLRRQTSVLAGIVSDEYRVNLIRPCVLQYQIGDYNVDLLDLPGSQLRLM